MLKILVAIKRVIDPYVKIRVKPDGTGVDTQQVKMVINPFDEIAIEEALRLKEKGKANEVVIVSIGDNTCQETLRAGLALGADRAIHIATEQRTILTPLNIAKILKKIVEKEQPDLCILGKQSIDGDNNQTGQMLAGLLNIGQGTFISSLEILDDKSIKINREVDGGTETLQLSLPAVITTDLRLNQPRYATLPNIMKAKQKPLEAIALDTLNLTLQSSLTVLKTEAPVIREGGEMVESVADLVDKLRNKEKVL